MIHLTKGFSMRPMFTVLFSLAILPLGAIHAAELSGTWQYEKGAEYFGQLKSVPAPAWRTLQISNGQLALSATCIVTLKPQRYTYSDAFQSLAKEDVDEPSLEKYLLKNFSVSLSKATSYYQASTQPSDCNKPLRDFLVIDNKLIIPFAGSAFYSFVRSDAAGSKAANASASLYGHKPSQLPFNTASYMNLCLATLPRIKGVPQAIEKCGPVYFPYVAAPNGDVLTQLIGTHDYQKGGARHAEDYANPFAHKLHPTFVVLPPLNDILLVRVDDLEPGAGENRDTMSGAFLVIKDGKVTDQINRGCIITKDYICTDEDGKPQYQLQNTGKFQKLN
ncbi:hypothetical protein LPN04_15200 [Rugamonas sp. A1-17]|nr:hypothetical protein [Rugamonas sp. A1-17]